MPPKPNPCLPLLCLAAVLEDAQRSQSLLGLQGQRRAHGAPATKKALHAEHRHLTLSLHGSSLLCCLVVNSLLRDPDKTACKPKLEYTRDYSIRLDCRGPGHASLRSVLHLLVDSILLLLESMLQGYAEPMSQHPKLGQQQPNPIPELLQSKPQVPDASV